MDASRPLAGQVARWVAAGVVVAGMWWLASWALSLAIVGPASAGLEGEEVPALLAPACLVATVLLYFGAGPVAACILRRRWAFWAPAAGIAAALVGVAIADVT